MPALLDAVAELRDARRDRRRAGRRVRALGRDPADLTVRHITAERVEAIEPHARRDPRVSTASSRRARAASTASRKAFLHFHDDGDDIYADVRLRPGPFERMRVTTKAEQRASGNPYPPMSRRSVNVPMDAQLLDGRARGEGLHARRRRARAVRRRTRGRRRPVRCSRSAPTAGSPRCTSARRHGSRARCCSPSTITVARRRTRPGGSTTIAEVVDPETGRMDTLPFFRRTIAGRRSSKTSSSRSSVIRSPVAARVAHAARLACSSTAVTRETSRSADYEGWARTSCPVACSCSTTCSRIRPRAARPRSKSGKRAVADGFDPVSTTGSLRVLRA